LGSSALSSIRLILALITVENRPDMPATAPPFAVIGLVGSDQGYPEALEPDRVALLVPAGGTLRGSPPGAALQRLLELALGRLRHGGGARVQAQAGDHRVGVAGVRVDRDPLALALLAPAHEARGVQRGLEQRAAVE